MKRVNSVLICIALFFSMGVFLFVTSLAQTQAVSKPAISSEQLERIRETIKNSQDLIRLDPHAKGEFAWMGYFAYAGLWDYYSLVCGEGDLEIYLTITAGGDDPDFDLYLFDCDGWELARSDSSGSVDESITYFVTPDTYTMGVYCYSGWGYYLLYGYYVTPPKMPDLVLQSLTASDYNPGIGDSITITLTVKNQGDTIAYDFWTDLFEDEIFPPSPPATGDYYWMTYDLNPGNTVQFTKRVTNSETETWQMYGLTDSEGLLDEKNECNNLQGPVEVTWSRPDLVVEEFTVADPSPFVDDFLDVTLTIRNEGARIDGNFRTDLYYNLPDAPTPCTPGAESFYKDGLSPGESYSCDFCISYQSPFLWHMWVYVDSWLNVSESDEDNNIDSAHVFWREDPISDDYGWPIHPSNQQHEISGTFMEWRSGGDYGHHYHDGIDIPAPADTSVYSVSAGLVNYTSDKQGIYVDEFLYYHVNFDTLKVPRNKWVNSDSLIAKIQTNHLHFSDGLNQQEVNALREDGIKPFADNIDPIFYPDPVTLREDDPYVGGWSGGADGQVISKDSVYGKVDIIVHAKDEINSGRRVGLYAISYQVRDENCNYIQGQDEILNFAFDSWYSNYHVNYIYADTSSRYKYIVTNEIASNGSWNTTELDDGTYCLKIDAYDIVSFYKKFVLSDTARFNETSYYLHDVEIKNGNRVPVIEGHIHCMYPVAECGDCVHLGEEMTIEIDASDEDGDTLLYEWWCVWGCFIVNGSPVAICTTDENYVLYRAPSDLWQPEDELWVFVYDNRGGSCWTNGQFEALDPADSCDCGDANDDGVVNSGDVVYLVSYLYKGGPEPVAPTERGDANNDCIINVGDVTYLVTYLYQGGPQPECCWFPPG
ncbi:MAG: CARDB domain-containing protein [Candidatus Zixiibacteriota bacterium]